MSEIEKELVKATKIKLKRYEDSERQVFLTALAKAVEKIDEDDYKIETIVQEVLNSSPGGKEIKIYLNPTDYRQCQKIQKEENIFEDIIFLVFVLK